MTKEEKNRRIAELLEPYESLPYGEHLDAEYQQADTSPREYWILTMVSLSSPGMYGLGWVPRDFYTDEAANALLLEAMPQPVLEKVFTNEPEKPEGDALWWCFHDCDATGVAVKSPDRKTAICSAYLAWKERR